MSESRHDRSARELIGHALSGRQAGMVAVAVALFSMGYAVDQLISATNEGDQAVPLIQADGFQVGSSGVQESIGGGEITIMDMKSGTCTLTNVTAALHFRHGRVVDVNNYQIPLDVGGSDIITVQDAVQYRHDTPGRHC